MTVNIRSWDIFCRVIDNYGDIAVCWRLARQLAVEHGLQVRLWVDDIAPLNALCPTNNAYEVEVCLWQQDFSAVTPANIVIEAFACELPTSYVTAMQQRPPVWINLEYLTAETWAVDFHCQPSLLPPLTKYFFFPGFTPRSGGLLHERVLTTPLPSATADELRISLFGYENNGLATLLDAWSKNATAVTCIAPQSRLLPQLQAWLENVPQRSNLTVNLLPFLTQDDYDGLLACCDLNFVRGEDSFVRAQLMGKPFVWHIYPQAEDAHLPKLQAFLQIYCADLPLSVANDVIAFHLAWNQGDMSAMAWNNFWRHSQILREHALNWRAQLLAQPDLACNLVKFCEDVFEKQQNKL